MVFARGGSFLKAQKSAAHSFVLSYKLIRNLLLQKGFLAADGNLLQGPLTLRGQAASKLPLHTKLLLKIIQQQVRAVLNF